MMLITMQNRFVANISLLTVLVAIISSFLGGVALGQSHSGHNQGPVAPLKEVPIDELLKPGELPEITLGRADAKITIVEYASMTCGHCGRVHRDIIPKLKSKYIDTGNVRLIIREFPLERVAMAVSMIARCAGPDKTYGVIAAMFDRQQQWLRSGDIRSDLIAISAEFGMTENGFKSCLENKKLFRQIKAVRQRAIDEFAVRSTPTFFINGKPLAGPRSIEEFNKMIAPLLKR